MAKDVGADRIGPFARYLDAAIGEDHIEPALDRDVLIGTPEHMFDARRHGCFEPDRIPARERFDVGQEIARVEEVNRPADELRKLILTENVSSMLPLHHYPPPITVASD